MISSFASLNCNGSPDEEAKDISEITEIVSISYVTSSVIFVDTSVKLLINEVI
jgi:hypothetical protein